MRKNYLIFSLLTLIGIMLTSCIKEEAGNTEADILTAEIPKDIQRQQPNIENNRVTFNVKYTTDLTKQSPVFTITEGATIEPASGTTRDFTNPQSYKVTSQDGKWSKNYLVSFTNTKLATKYTFNNFEIREGDKEPEKWFTFFEIDSNDVKYYPWAHANSAFYYSIGNDATPYQYPTTVDAHGFEGSALKLTTLSTGFFGKLLKKPIAAGSSFLGKFDTQKALTNSLEAINLGIPFDKIPIALNGKFKYTSGEVFIEVNNNKIIETPGKKIIDKFDIYAILFENKVEGNNIHLNGINKFTHPNVVAIAKIDQANAIETNSWTDFSLPFIYQKNKQIDLDKLKKDNYSIAIVLSSSAEGDYFKGALESTLLIDELEIIYEEAN